MRNSSYKLFAMVSILVLASTVSSAFAEDTASSDIGTVSQNGAMNEPAPTYEEIMNQYSVEDQALAIGPSRLLGRLYAAETATGDSNYRVERLELALLYDRNLSARATLAEWEAAPFRDAMPNSHAYDQLWTRLNTDKRALEKYEFVRNFRHAYEVSVAVKKILSKADDYFAGTHEVAETKKKIATMEGTLKENPPKDDIKLLSLFVLKEVLKERLADAERAPLE